MSTKSVNTSQRTRIGWQGIALTLPPDWSLTGISTERRAGYIKIDSPGTMFVQIRWEMAGNRPQPKSLNDWVKYGISQLQNRNRPVEIEPPDLGVILDRYLKEAEKRSHKQKEEFESKAKSETVELSGERIARNFQWVGGGVGQGKIWYCRHCQRIVMAQVVGRSKDDIGAVASELFSTIRDHGEEGWQTWALYDLCAEVPEQFQLEQYRLMAGALRLEFRRGGKSIMIERWGLANVLLRNSSLEDWYAHMVDLPCRGIEKEETEHAGHTVVHFHWNINDPLARLRAIRDGFFSHTISTGGSAAVWHCPANNKIFGIRMHHPYGENIVEQVVERCRCH
ncbi:MAG: hypothetical protein M1330_04345 [Armatimonadetes bacterium]|nr:hypothetical protein [Armatimonadota bacterium]